MTRFQFRRGTSASTSANNPVLADGEPGYEKDTGVLKVGDGVTAWASLPAVLSGTYASGLPEYLEAVPVAVYGHSWNMSPGKYSTGNEWHKRLGVRRFGTISNNAISGGVMMEAAFSAVGTDWFTGFSGSVNPTGNLRTYAAGTAGIAVVNSSVNDITRPLATDAAFQNGYKHSLRTLLATLRAGQRIEAEAATTISGTWNTFSDKKASGGSMLNSPSAGVGVSYLEFAGVVVPAGVTTLHVLTWVTDSTNPMGSLNVSVDGASVVADWDPVGQMKSFTSITAVTNTYNFSLGVISVPVTAGTRTVRVTHGSLRNNGAFVDCLLVPSAAPPLVIVCKEPPITYGTFAANKATYFAFIDSIVAEFPGVVIADLSPGWDNATMIGADLLHPTGKGQRAIADTVQAKIQATVTGYRAGVSFK